MPPKNAAKLIAVDDENDILLILKTALSEDYDVRTASGGADALAMMAESRPDLVILDMMMPEMNGFDVLRKMKETPALATVPVIFLTGISDKAKIRQALDMGTKYYIVKPFDYNQLMEKVTLALRDAASPIG